MLALSEEDGLIAYWSFDEGEGTIAHDYSGNANDATVVRAKWVDGVCGKALALEKGSDVLCGGGLELCFVFPGDYTIEVWVRHKSKTPQIYVGKWTGSGVSSGWWLGYYEGSVQFGDYYDGGQVRIKGPDIADGQWHYVVGMRKGRKIYLYVDGGEVAEGRTPGKVAGDNLAPLRIGGFGTRYKLWAFEGEIDEVRIYERALSKEEIWNRYNLIKMGKKSPTLSPISQGLPLTFYVSVTTATVYDKDEPKSCLITITSSKPTLERKLKIAIKDEKGSVLGVFERKIQTNTPQKVTSLTFDIPIKDEGNYQLQVYIDKELKSEKTLIVKNMEPIKKENISIVQERAKTNPFYRGIISAYAGMIYKKDGSPDIEATISFLKELGVNCYTYLIFNHSEKELANLADFCDKAMKEGIEVWAYLVPPSEAPKDYPPYGLDYIKWAEAIADISRKHPNLTLWMIDDFDGNLSFFSRDYTRQLYETSKRINPNLLFGVCVYHEGLQGFINAGYLNYTDAILWGYQHNSSLYPDCGLYPYTLPLEINDYLKTGKIPIPCIYFTPHSSWPEGRPTKEYLETAMKIAFEQAGICFVYTTPTPGTFQYDVVKGFTNSHRLPTLK
ncbi:MAG: LamG domain-containing protein [bacterium]